ncbi:MAG: O-antigen ligase family protein [Desulfuromonadaceae bacterium]|nr:O-antigen ligase family protein [Desulfuromonadaceae bacterium]
MNTKLTSTTTLSLKHDAHLACGIERSKGFNSLWAYMGAAIVIFYLLRGSVFFLWAGSAQPLLTYGGQALLLLAAALVLLFKTSRLPSVPAFFFIVFTLLSAMCAELFYQSLAKWAGWVILFITMGPVITSPTACWLRESSWRAFRAGFITISIASLAWSLLGLPSYWRGSFTGVTTYSMLLAPMAAISVLICANYAITRRSLLFACLSIASLFPCLLAGSRAALLALAVAFIVLIGILSYRKSSASIIVLMAMLLLAGFTVFEFSDDLSIDNNTYTNTIIQKGLTNTREKLWKARWQEFNENVFVGVGIGMGKGEEEAGVQKDASGNINVEPGSSYLALLSMTGILGSFGFLLVIVALLRIVFFLGSTSFQDIYLTEAFVVLIFLLINMVAEGWILAVGSPFCLLFWLNLGRIWDLAKQKAYYARRGNVKVAPSC